MNRFVALLWAIPPLSWKRERDELRRQVAGIADAAQKIMEANNSMTEEVLEIQKSTEILRKGLLNIATLMDSGRTMEARKLIEAFLLGDRKSG